MTSCCTCKSKCLTKEMLIPRRCLEINGFKSHRICTECWFGSDDEVNVGFANEKTSHACPGCINGFDLTVIFTGNNPEEAITIDDDDDE